MKRGEIWTLQDKNYASKARPVLIIQSDSHSEFNSIILCLFTTFISADIDTRVYVKATSENGLFKDSYIMTDKIITVDKTILGEKIGRLSKADMNKVSQQLKVILDL